MLFQVDGAGHAWKNEFCPIIGAQTEAVEVAVVIIGDDLRMICTLEQPCTECCLEFLLLHLCLRRALDIEYTDGVAIRVDADFLLNARILLIQAVEHKVIGTLARNRKGIFGCRCAMLLLLDAPLARLRSIAHLHVHRIVGTNLHRVNEKTLYEVWRQPRRAKRNRNLVDGQWLRQNIDERSTILLCASLTCAEIGQTLFYGVLEKRFVRLPFLQILRTQFTDGFRFQESRHAGLENMLFHKGKEMQCFERMLLDFLSKGLPICMRNMIRKTIGMLWRRAKRSVPEMHRRSDGMKGFVSRDGGETMNKIRIAPQELESKMQGALWRCGKFSRACRYRCIFFYLEAALELGCLLREKFGREILAAFR